MSVHIVHLAVPHLNVTNGGRFYRAVSVHHVRDAIGHVIDAISNASGDAVARHLLAERLDLFGGLRVGVAVWDDGRRGVRQIVYVLTNHLLEIVLDRRRVRVTVHLRFENKRCGLAEVSMGGAANSGRLGRSHRSVVQVGSAAAKGVLTIVSRPTLSMAFSMGKESCLKISRRLLKAVTLSSSLPRPSWSFEQSRRMMVGFCLNCAMGKSCNNQLHQENCYKRPIIDDLVECLS